MPPPEPAIALATVAGELGLALDAEGRDRLLRYLALLERWNAVYNLSGVRDPAQMLTQHLADCMAVVPALQRHVGANPARLLDVGSGGGLPGVVIAVLCPLVEVTCIDAVAKKAAFVRQVAAELGLANLRTEHGRVEQWAGVYDVIVSRAFSALAELVRLTRHLVAPDGVWMAMKGRAPDDERRALPADIDVFHVEPLRVPGLSAERCVVWMRAA